MRYTLKRAAELAEASYSGKSAAVIKSQFKAALDEEDVQAVLLTDDTLLIPGSNSINDYLRYNLRVRGLFRRNRLKMVSRVKGAPVTWHQGFLAHAKIVQDWLLRKNYTDRKSTRLNSSHLVNSYAVFCLKKKKQKKLLL